MFKKINLEKSSYDFIFKFLQTLCMSHQIKLQAINGDGDKKYRKFNKSPDFSFSCPVNGSYFEGFAQLILSPDYFFNSDNKWVAQDVLHGAKKLRNALRAVTARFIIFGPPQYYNSLASWSILYELWILNNWHTDIKIICMKSSVDYKDRQDPTLPPTSQAVTYCHTCSLRTNVSKLSHLSESVGILTLAEGLECRNKTFELSVRIDDELQRAHSRGRRILKEAIQNPNEQALSGKEREVKHF